MITIEDKRKSKRKEIPKVVQIEAAHYVVPYKLSIWFDDGRVNTVDFGRFLRASAHPAIRAYLDVERFKKFTLEDGVLHWNDFDLIFPMADLYRGRIS